MPVKRVGWIPNAAAEDDAFAQAVSQALSEALEKLGWKESGNLLLDRRTNLGSDFGRFRLAAAELVKSPRIYAGGAARHDVRVPNRGR